MSSTLTVIWWRDIPAQVIAKSGRRSHKVVLSPRFQDAIDRAAMKAGLIGQQEYLEEWRRDAQNCEDDLESAAQGEAERLEVAYPDDRLRALVGALGMSEPISSAEDR